MKKTIHYFLFLCFPLCAHVVSLQSEHPASFDGGMASIKASIHRNAQLHTGQAVRPPQRAPQILGTDIPRPPIAASIPEARTIWEFVNEHVVDRGKLLQHSFSVGQLWVRGIPGFDVGTVCSGTMVSPHIFMTAAHCGGSIRTGVVRFFRIDEDSSNPGDTAQTFSQFYYAQAFQWESFSQFSAGGGGDTRLWWVSDGSDGMPPGIKYGHVELSPQMVKEADPAYSFWVNPVENFRGARLDQTILYSQGAVTKASYPDPDGWRGPTTDYDIYGAPGASGSSIIGSGRLGYEVIGVTSCTPRPEGAYRCAADIQHLLKTYDTDRNEALDALEYDVTSRTFARTFTLLQLETPLQRSQWRWIPERSSLTNEPGHWVAKVEGQYDQEWVDDVWHATSIFEANATYRISILVYGRTDIVSGPAYLKFRSDASNTAVVSEFRPVNGEWKRLSLRVKLENQPDYRLVFGQKYYGNYYIRDVAIVREDAGSLDFETGDERRAWEYTATSYPSSWGIGGATDFSAVVVGPSPLNVGWSIRNRFVALRPARSYEIEYSAKHIAGSVANPAFTKIQDLAGWVLFNREWVFDSNNQERRLKGTFVNQTDRAMTVTFGSTGPIKYFVDQVRIREIE